MKRKEKKEWKREEYGEIQRSGKHWKECICGFGISKTKWKIKKLTATKY